jgi:hypothetical protein
MDYRDRVLDWGARSQSGFLCLCCRLGWARVRAIQWGAWALVTGIE